MPLRKVSTPGKRQGQSRKSPGKCRTCRSIHKISVALMKRSSASIHNPGKVALRGLSNEVWSSTYLVACKWHSARLCRKKPTPKAENFSHEKYRLSSKMLII